MMDTHKYDGRDLTPDAYGVFILLPERIQRTIARMNSAGGRVKFIGEYALAEHIVPEGMSSADFSRHISVSREEFPHTRGRMVTKGHDISGTAGTNH